MIKQYFYIIILVTIVFMLLGCSNVRMACHIEGSQSTATTKDQAKDSSAFNSLKDTAQECTKNPTVIIFKEF